jgi:isopenicillin N synthase-like dioxygenase
MRAASEDMGMFYLAGHKIPQTLLRSVYLCSTRLFLLSEEFKKDVSVNETGRRYIVERDVVFKGAERAGKDFPGDDVWAGPSSGNRTGQIIDNLPRSVYGNSPAEVVQTYYRHIFALNTTVLQACAALRQLPPEWRWDKHPVIYARLLAFPCASFGGISGPVHPDGEPMVILWSDRRREVRVWDAATTPAVPPVPKGRLALRVADMMARWTPDLLVSIPHRLMDEAGHEDFAIPVFYSPDDGVRVQSLAGCVDFDPSGQGFRLQ